MKRTLLIAILIGGMAGTCIAQADAPLLVQKPAVNRTEIVFVYAGDLWTVSREGGTARRLTTDVGTESDPVFSPDGRQPRFARQLQGQRGKGIKGQRERQSVEALCPLKHTEKPNANPLIII